MNAEDRQRLKEAFNVYAQNSPDPDAPAFGFVGGKMLSPREIAAEVNAETQTGKDILDMVGYSVDKVGIDSVVERLTRRAPKP
jgi:hypothetical protein